MNGHAIECGLCGGAGYRTVWSFGVKEPDECRDCGGSGLNWQYAGGTIARYYSGPLIGREIIPPKPSSDGDGKHRNPS